VPPQPPRGWKQEASTRWEGAGHRFAGGWLEIPMVVTCDSNVQVTKDEKLLAILDAFAVSEEMQGACKREGRLAPPAPAGCLATTTFELTELAD
jgi:hypothetical protein